MQKWVPFRIRCCASAVNAQNIHDLQKVWAERIEYFVSTHQYRELDNIDGEPVVFEWKIFPGAHNTGVSRGSPRIDGERTRNSAVEISRTASSLCQCTTTFIGEEKATKYVKKIHRVLLHTPKVFPKDTGHSSDL